MRLEVSSNLATPLSDGRFCRKCSLLFAMLLQPFKLMIHAIFHAYRCRRREVCKWCRDDVREAGEAVREERRGGRGQFRTRRKLIKHGFQSHVCVSMPSWCMGPSLACTSSSPGIFWGGSPAGRRGPIPGHSDLPWGYPTRPWYCFTTKQRGLFCPSLQGGVRYAQAPLSQTCFLNLRPKFVV
jgi:hypothetical protein